MITDKSKMGAPGSEVELPVTWGDVIHFLRGMEFPCTREDLVNFATYKGGTPGLLADLQNLEDREYSGMEDVRQEFQKQVQ